MRNGVMPVEPGAHLPLGRRVRLELLIALQHLVNRRLTTALRLRERAPGAVGHRLRRLVAPVRIGNGGTLARVPLNTDPLRRATVPFGVPAPSEPRASVLVVSFESFMHTRLCLSALRAFTDPKLYELIVVDNGSRDGTPDFLRDLRGRWPHLRLIEEATNRGFAAAVNTAAGHARGETLVILNHDVVVTPGWLTGLLNHLDRRSDGALVGPRTNDSGDLAEIRARYGSLDELLDLAAHRGQIQAGRARDVGKLALFCAAIRRGDFFRCGGLDEGYGLGMFEDDDLCLTLREGGRRVLLAEDVYVHHAAGASFRRWTPREYLTQFEHNRARFERKWSTRWTPPATER